MKTCITLSKDLLLQIDQLTGSKGSRSTFIERISRRYFRERRRAAPYARDSARIKAAAIRLDSEAEDVLEYQTSRE